MDAMEGTGRGEIIEEIQGLLDGSGGEPEMKADLRSTAMCAGPKFAVVELVMMSVERAVS